MLETDGKVQSESILTVFEILVTCKEEGIAHKSTFSKLQGQIIVSAK